MLPRAITGYGVTSTLGIGREAFVEALGAPKALEPEQGRKLTTVYLAK